MTRTVTALLVSAICLSGSHVFSQGPSAEEKNPGLKYHAALQKHPEPGYLFDRFYNAWLDGSTAESLQDFLQKQVEQSDTTANRLLLAFFHSKQNNDLAAIEEFGKALKTDPASAVACYYRALAESRTLDFDAAIADLKRGLALKPNAKLSVAIQRQLGTMLVAQSSDQRSPWRMANAFGRQPRR